MGRDKSDIMTWSIFSFQGVLPRLGAKKCGDISKKKKKKCGDISILNYIE